MPAASYVPSASVEGPGQGWGEACRRGVRGPTEEGSAKGSTPVKLYP